MTIRHEQYGIAANICARARVARNAVSLNQWLMPAILHDQIMFVFDKSGSPLGYWTWAFLSSEVEVRLSLDPCTRLHESEWNEGEALWIIDFVSCGGYVRDMVAFIVRSFHFGHDLITIRKCATGKDRIRHSKWRRKLIDDYDARVRNSPIYSLPRCSFAVSHTAWLSDITRPTTAF